jgi:hypothetical protein
MTVKCQGKQQDAKMIFPKIRNRQNQAQEDFFAILEDFSGYARTVSH